VEIFVNTLLRDCTANNIMLDPSRMYPEGFHPVKINRSRDFKKCAKRYTRTQRSTRYLLVDFGLSRQYSSRYALDEPVSGGDKSAPEHRHWKPCNPFRTDIYYLGNLVREYFVEVISLEVNRYRLLGLTVPLRSTTVSNFWRNWSMP
jgi:hypothetical protein